MIHAWFCYLHNSTDEVVWGEEGGVMLLNVEFCSWFLP